MNQLDEETLRRCAAALKIWLQGQHDLLVLCGGMFNPPTIQTKPAAVLMQAWFVRCGVDPNHILVEAQSRDTFENIWFTLQDLARERIIDYRITVISYWQHALRIWTTFRLGYGIRVACTVTHGSIPWKWWLREWCYIVYHLFDPRGTKLFAQKNRQRRTH